MAPTVGAILARALPGATVASVTPSGTGNSKRTVFVSLADGREVVVQSRPLAAGGLATETALSRAVARRTDVPVPRVLAAGELAGHAYAVSETVAGSDLHTRFTALSTADRERLARAFGRHLAALHGAFAFEGYGAIDSRDGDLSVADPTTDWPSWFDGYLERGLDALGTELADLAPEISAAVAPDSLPERPTARLYPWDLRPGNAVVAGAPPEVVALLDWGDPLAAAPGLSLAKTDYLVVDWYLPAERERDRLREAFRAGYRERRALPAVPRSYRLAAVVHTAYDSRGRVTTPGYPEVDSDEAATFHRRTLRSLLDGDG